jgi:hypothetical protein
LQRQHYIRQFFNGDYISIAELADVIVLTKNAPQVATGEKYCSRTRVANQRRLLSEMSIIAGDMNLSVYLAIAQLSLDSINLAIARTESATF